MANKPKKAREQDLKHMMLILKKNDYNRKKAANEYARIVGVTPIHAYRIVNKVGKLIGSFDDAPILINELLSINNVAIKHALKDAIKSGDFMEYERVVKLQVEALGLGARHTNINVNNTQQNNTLYQATTEELLSLVRDGQERYSKLLTGPTTAGRETVDGAIEVLHSEPRRADANPFK